MEAGCGVLGVCNLKASWSFVFSVVFLPLIRALVEGRYTLRSRRRPSLGMGRRNMGRMGLVSAIGRIPLEANNLSALDLRVP